MAQILRLEKRREIILLLGNIEWLKFLKFETETDKNEQDANFDRRSPLGAKLQKVILTN